MSQYRACRACKLRVHGSRYEGYGCCAKCTREARRKYRKWVKGGDAEKKVALVGEWLPLGALGIVLGWLVRWLEAVY